MDYCTQGQIKAVLNSFMQKVIKRVSNKDSSDSSTLERTNPFGFRLVPIQIFKSGEFVKTFVSALEQEKIFEQLALVIAEGTGAEVQIQDRLDLAVSSNRQEKINEILTLNKTCQRAPNWQRDVNDVLSLKKEKPSDCQVNFDLYIKRNHNEEFYFLNTSKPNSEQTEVKKQDMLLAKAAKEECEVYLALSFNLDEADSFPGSFFDQAHDQCVLTGPGFWNKIGQSSETYNELLVIFEELGKTYEPIIKKDCLGMERFCG